MEVTGFKPSDMAIVDRSESLAEKDWNLGYFTRASSKCEPKFVHRSICVGRLPQHVGGLLSAYLDMYMHFWYHVHAGYVQSRDLTLCPIQQQSLAFTSPVTACDKFP